MTETTYERPAASGQEPDVLVDVRGVKVHFPIKRGVIFDKVIGYVYAVDGVDLQIRRGETYGLVGESGCGKSTLGKAILNLEPPTEGSVTIDGVDVAALKGEELRRMRKDFQMVFQDPMGSLDPRQSVESLLVEGMKAHGLADDEKSTAARLRQLLADVGLPPAALKKYPHEFSGGQRQRIGIARALALNPDLLICDEPVSALDLSVQAQVLNLLVEIQEEFKLSLLFISHDLSVVAHLADRIMVMYLGHIVEIGTRDAVWEQPLHPYTRGLIGSVPSHSPRGQPIAQITGMAPSLLDLPEGCPFRPRCPRADELCTNAPEVTTPLPGRAIRCHHPYMEA